MAKNTLSGRSSAESGSGLKISEAPPPSVRSPVTTGELRSNAMNAMRRFAVEQTPEAEAAMKAATKAMNAATRQMSRQIKEQRAALKKA